jgi:hypothetical protein
MKGALDVGVDDPVPDLARDLADRIPPIVPAFAARTSMRP